MLEHNVTRLILLMTSILVLSLFITIVINPDFIVKIYNAILGQQMDTQRSAETIKVVMTIGLR